MDSDKRNHSDVLACIELENTTGVFCPLWQFSPPCTVFLCYVNCALKCVTIVLRIKRLRILFTYCSGLL